jgi:thiol-disulfide isomerase/thioredoxin
MQIAALVPLALTLASGMPGQKGAHVPKGVKDRSGIVWMHDEWPKAKQIAIDSHQLVAVDVWATWCHSCLSMRQLVFTDKAMAKVAKQHVWLAMDYDRPKNADFFAKFPAGALPMPGSGSAKQMADFFRTADRSAKDPLTLGERFLAREDYPEARKIFEAALKKPPKDKAEHTRILNGYVEALWKIDPKSCAKIGVERMKEVDNTTQGLDLVSTVVFCAADLDPEAKKSAMEAVVARLAPLAEKKDLPLVVDDRSGIYEALTEAYDALGEKEKVEATVKARALLLEEAAAKAETPAERATYDAHRFDCYLRLGRFEDAEKMLKLSEEAQPDDFNHPWRLAVLYSKQGKSNDGLAAIDRALTKGYGARRLRLYATKVDLLIQKKSFEIAKQTVADAKKEIADMNPNQVRPSWVKELDSKLEQIAKLEKSS